MYDLTLAAVEGNIHVAAAALGIPLSIGLIGLKACEAVGRNPVLVQSIIAMAFAEAIVFFAIFLV
jgi:F-type H+-transporting ATPase subunit c